jgi:phosphate transport system protein
MERHFDEELAALKGRILQMGSLVEASIEKSVEALKQLDALQAGKVIVEDKIIDELELQIDEVCVDLLALRQPMAHDLRFIAMAMKITTDLERMADLAVDIAQRVLEMASRPLLKPLIDIPKLTVLAQRMTNDAINAFVSSDTELAGEVILRDAEADKLRNMVQKELIDDYIKKDPSTVSRAIPLLLIARHLERICDHATNISEDVIYMAAAKVVKHHPEKLQE